MKTFIQNATDTFVQDSKKWGLRVANALMIAGIPILLMIGMVALIRVPNLFVWITAENSLMEWLQFLLILAACLIFARLGIRLLRSGQPHVGILGLLVALGTFFIAGEEIAWGQQVFGWQTPEALEAVNVQQETTLHNISTAHAIFVYAAMLAGLYGTVMPFLGLLGWHEKVPIRLRNLLIPPLCLVPAFFMPFAYRFSRLFLGVDDLLPRFIFHVTKLSEVSELCFYFGLMIFAWLNLRQLRSTAPWNVRQVASRKKLEL